MRRCLRVRRAALQVVSGNGNARCFGGCVPWSIMNFDVIVTDGRDELYCVIYATQKVWHSALFYIINEPTFLSRLQALHLVERNEPARSKSRQSFVTVALSSNSGLSTYLDFFVRC